MLIFEKRTIRAEDIVHITTIYHNDYLFLEIHFVDGKIEYMDIAEDLLISIERKGLYDDNSMEKQ